MSKVNRILDYKNLNNLSLSEEKNRDRLFSRYFIDHLTNLPNLYQLRNDLEDLDQYSLVLISIDDIQTIKNFYGYLAADYIVEEFAEILKKELHEKVYKISSHEFAIVLQKKMFFYDLKDYLDSICLNMKNTIIEYNNQKIYIDFTLSSSSSVNNKNIFSKVYMALKYAIDIGTHYWIYEDSMNFEEDYAKDIQMSQVIREAVEDSKIVPYFQAIIDTKTLQVQKYECLARLIDSNGKIISPICFIPLSKKIKHYNLITKLIIEKSFTHFESIGREFTINISIEDIVKKDMFDFIMRALRFSSVSDKVTFEILESDAIEDFEKVDNFVNEIRRYGAKIAIDDFGSGYSNFSYLTKLNVDYIKIDGSLIKNMDTDYNSFIVVETIVQFAKKLNIKIVAEYVHSREILDKIKELKIELAQGFYFNEPSLFTSYKIKKDVS